MCCLSRYYVAWCGSMWLRDGGHWQPVRLPVGLPIELTGVDVRLDGWDIRGRWFGVVVGAAPRLGELQRGETIPWHVIAAQIAPRERRSSH